MNDDSCTKSLQCKDMCIVKLVIVINLMLPESSTGYYENVVEIVIGLRLGKATTSTYLFKVIE